MVMSRDGKTLYVALGLGLNGVAAIDTATFTVVNTIEIDGEYTHGLAISPDGTTLYAGDRDTGFVTPIDIATGVAGTPIDTSQASIVALGACSNGNAYLAPGGTFVAHTSGALKCTLSGATGADGPVFSGGTRQFAGTDIASDLPITLEAQGGIFDTRGNNAELSGPITGIGSLAKIGDGTLTLSGPGTYPGPTFVGAGTLQAGIVDAFSPNSAYVLAPGATLDLNNRNQTIGSLGGAGDVTLGSATLTTGKNNADTIFSGVISGTGGLAKTGTGTLTLSGDGLAYTGPTTVSEGRLLVDGMLANSPVSVLSGALLGGSGTIGALTAASDAVVAPGVAVRYSTLSVAGNVGFSVGSTFAVNINAAGQNDKLAVGGTATLSGGTIDVAPAPGVYTPASRYTLLTAAGGVSGRFAELATPADLADRFAFLSPELLYGPDAVTLGFTETKDISTAATTRNQVATANALQALGVGNPLFDIVVGQSFDGARQAFNALSGEVHASLSTAAFQDFELIRAAILDRLARSEATPATTSADTGATGSALAPSFWMQAIGDDGHVKSDGNAATLSRSTGGFLLGGDVGGLDLLGGEARLGAAGGYLHDNLDIPDRSATAAAEQVFAALYGSDSFGPVAVSLGAAFSHLNQDLSRQIVFPSVAEGASSDGHGWLGQTFGEFGYCFEMDNPFGAGAPMTSAMVEPFVGGAAIHLHQDGFAERGGLAALSAPGQSSDVETTTLGVRLEAKLATAVPLTARAMVGWRHAYGDVTPEAALVFAGGSDFTVAGAPLDRDALVTEFELDTNFSQRVSFSLSYAGQFGTLASENAVNARLTVKF